MRKDNISPIVISKDFKVSAETHHINVSIAKEVGLVESILLSHFFFWYQCNNGNNKFFKDGKVWFFKSVSQICEIYPYLSQERVKRAIERLVQSGLVHKQPNEEDGLKRANLYSLSDIVISWYDYSKAPNDGYNTQRDVQYPTKDNNKEDNSNNKEIEDKSSTENGWRTDKSEYVKLIDEAVGELLMDEEYRKQQEEVYVNIDYRRTIIACGNYWKDDEQWESYKRKKINKPNFVSAIKKGFHINKIYNSRFQQQETQAPAAEMTIKDKFENFLKWLHAKRGDRAMMSYRISMNDFCEMIKAYPSSATLCLIVLNITEQPIEPNEKLIDVFRRYRNTHP